MSHLLQIKNLHASVDKKEILKGLNLEIKPGEIHAIMGPNGSGKSTLSAALMGHPGYKVTNGKVLYKGKDLLKLKPEQRAHAGLFLAFQYPQTIPGVNLVSFIRASFNALQKARDPKAKPITMIEFRKRMREAMKELDLPAAFMTRATNDGFSGGEKKKAEILQMKMLAPELAILDETDSGLDIDALKVICENLNKMKNKKRSMIFITHYQRILQYIKPDHVHVMMDGQIVMSGGKELAEELEKGGYDVVRKKLGMEPGLKLVPETA